MSILNINRMNLSTVLMLYTDRATFHLDPDYQRQSDIWNMEKRQLLIDSIINGYDIPKLYFHKYPRPKKIKGSHYTYAIIDGKQRLESIWKFIDGNFPLSPDAEYLRDPTMKIAGLTYRELGQHHPSLKTRFDAFPLDVIVIETDDLELIEDMFSRLNEAMPLSAAEKRNALGGPIPKLIRHIVKHDFFARCLPFGNTRYRHYDLAAKFYLISEKQQVVDTKKVYLDDFVKAWKKKVNADPAQLNRAAERVLTAMGGVFVEGDRLLKSVGMVTLYFHAFRMAVNEGWQNEITRSKFMKFEELRRKNRVKAQEDLSTADYNLLEFDRFIQAPNDGYATQLRLEILLDKVFRRRCPQQKRGDG